MTSGQERALRSGYFEGVNPATESTTGVRALEFIGRTPCQVFGDELGNVAESNYRKCLQAGGPTTYDEFVELPGGSYVLQTLLVPVKDAQGRIHRIVGCARDVTEVRKTELALQQVQKLESLGVLAGGIAHDFNNLLTVVLGNAELAILRLAPESPALSHLEAIKLTIRKASDLTRQMLAYSGRSPFVVKPHNLNQVVQEMTHLLRVSIPKKVKLSLHLAEELPPVAADAAQIQQVVMNLVTNAADAIGNQFGTVAVVTAPCILEASELETMLIKPPAPGAFVMLEVTDTGCGMSPEVLARIFDPFFTTKEWGRGLGLSAMLGIVRGHHAGIELSSNPGQGSSFRLYFPAQASLDAGRATPVSRPCPTYTGVKALVADDEELVCDAARASLSALGFAVETANDGVEALERFRRSPDQFDLVLLDLTMPRADGLETFEAIHGIRPEVPIILCSGYSEQSSVNNLVTRGLAGFLQKPYLLDELREIVRVAMSRRQKG